MTLAIQRPVRQELPRPSLVPEARSGAEGTVVLGGVLVHLYQRAEALRRVADRLRAPRDRPLALASANLDHLHHFGAGRPHAKLLDSTTATVEWLVLLDGMPLVWTADRLTGGGWPQLAGSDILPDMLSIAQRDGRSVGFFGGSPETHTNLQSTLASRYPDLRIAGWWSPRRTELADGDRCRALAAEVQAAGVDLLVVSLGKPRQEAWSSEFGAATGAAVILTFGAAADFMAGTAQRAPAWTTRVGLEWAYRLALEPRRLSRRYLLQGPLAMLALLTRSHA